MRSSACNVQWGAIGVNVDCAGWIDALVWGVASVGVFGISYIIYQLALKKVFGVTQKKTRILLIITLTIIIIILTYLRVEPSPGSAVLPAI